MNRLAQYRWWLPALAILTLLLVACERPINPDSPTPTASPILPATLVVPTTDPNAVPTTDPAQATAVPDVTAEPGVEATAVPDAAATTAPDTGEPRGEVMHTVVAGDTLTGLSLLYDVPVDVIVAANNLTNIDSLDIGQVLVIPAEGTTVDTVPTTEPSADATAVPPSTGEITHVVQAGENLFRIGLQYGFTVDELAAYNGLANPNALDVGQVIKIPPSN
ncbi:MAG: LysM peptidoglycan-binding domain-containing protein [Ardenticatenaceae bacterium]|nr:LysM peptidoglycan-binding domain-containing protein [Ardenticatenaceae bacterium]